MLSTGPLPAGPGPGLLATALITLAHPQSAPIVKPDLDAMIRAHFAAIPKRDLAAFRSHLTRGDTLHTVVQSGHAFTTPAQITEAQAEWFKDPAWTWEGPPAGARNPVQAY